MSQPINPPLFFVGNYDQGIHVNAVQIANIDAAFQGHTTGDLARKCMEVAPRVVHMLDEHDAVLLYAPLPEAFASYCEDLYGYRPQVYHPGEPYRDFSEPLDLVERSLRDERLIAMLREDAKRFNWRMEPFIGHPSVFELARKSGMSTGGFSEQAVLANKVAELNDKALFQHFCRSRGIPTPASVHVLGWENLMTETERQYQARGSVMLRRARAAGGLGNCLVTDQEMDTVGASSVRQYLEIKLQPHEEWDHETVLVEPVLKILSSPTVLLRADHGRMRIVAVIDQVLKGASYIGGNFPTGESAEDARQLELWALEYGTQFVLEGGEGWFDIDFGRLEDGSFVAFESNGRCTGNNHGLAVRHRLFKERANQVHAWTNDALKVRPGTPFEQVLNQVPKDVLWCPSREDGVIITIPPGGDDQQFSMGYVALANSTERKHELRDAMDRFAQQTYLTSLGQAVILEARLR
ncbi:hypothetical protein CO174_00305 [Candidatus Uhrbacteria bacterium CG_4_9_14_3_um_filter_50_9]|uniref:ATP-grasp domain-containing protein n=1 Tax=Candidatus Uhrbacteria bacterium CG_4_9_14_3_um_filter_50_9 TaxID=1975035 RepID=A0A2M7XEN8_9BACT|nr:MAG: hypothetical protein CO174_00305 [Candidatus Uhrbacteria bacterium CG_4_9_14_3_um_filter_50_9]